ncbi:MAG: protein kinase [Pseudomonadota bacterium]
MWPKKAKQRRFSGSNRGYWLAGLLLSLLVYALAQTAILDPLERGYYKELLARIASTERSGYVVVLDTGKGAAQTELTDAVAKLRRARSVALMLPLTERENVVALQQLEQLNEKGGNKVITGLTKALDSTARLAAKIKRSGNVWLAAHATTVQESLNPDSPSVWPYFRSQSQPRVLAVESERSPLSELESAAQGRGFLFDSTGYTELPAFLMHGGEPTPSLLYRLLPSDRQRHAEEQPGYRYYPKVDINNAEGLPVHPLHNLVDGTLPVKSLRDKIVLIGEAAEIKGFAVALDALLRGQQVSLPQWTLWAQYGALFGVALFLMLLLPRLGLASGLLSSLLLLLVLLNTEALFLLLSSQWLPLMMPTLLLLAGYIVITLQRRVILRESGLLQELSTANMQLGRMLQSQGELEQAWEKYHRCLIDETLREQLYNLGLDFERKRQFNKAVSLFEELQRMARNFRDVGERLQRNREMGDRIVLAQGNAAPGGTVVMQATQGLQNPTLGHYHIEKEIGRGAMGLVYLGQDPRINREVAIKTMALSHEFEGQELKEVKQRFYREAETAGRLNHPNIVTIYDIGEEQELAYIAMDYLKGEDLSAFSSKKTLLPLKEVMAIAEQVAEALDYAHKQNVVHRDIKPANIIYERGEKVVKVTDFGVACLTDSSKTKTGTVLGSPSYMSPEQVAGKKVDGRADIFSLGVTIYQLSTGHLPFEAESLGSLMFMIANQAHPKPGKYRKGIPICLTRIINKCLQKEQAKRYQSAAEVAAALKRCRGG